ncbi:proton myo-inositol cotransporter-like isoform X2 [Watersipora subatra]|uniref:proton myo-inositol cotransporter-like isoform X2 n=1 Tax=Watersipora subatra TaxID=2589382 RepID=UPI00355BAA08
MGATMSNGICAEDASLLENEQSMSIEDDPSNAIRPSNAPRTPCYVFILAFLSAIGGFLFGYDTGVVAGASLPIAKLFEFTTVDTELFVSITIGAAAIFAIVGGILNDKVGRKPTTLIASVVFTIGAIVLAAANSTKTLLIGRFIVGIGIGLSSCTVPVYVSECSPPTLRGMLVTLINLCITAGQFTSSVVDGLFCRTVGGWRWMLGLAATPAIVQFFGFIFMPESPRWLVSQGKDQEAIRVLQRLRGTLDVNDEYNGIKAACDEETRCKEVLGNQFIGKKVWDSLPVRRALIIGCMLQLFQQITGINTVMYYSATIISMAGVQDPCKAIWYASITALVNFLFTFVGIALVERIGRRMLFLSSLLGVTISLVFLGIGFQVEAGTAPDVTLPSDFTSDLCSTQFSTCTACIEDKNCGFCFNKDPLTQKINSTCLSSDEHFTASVSGLCSDMSSSGYSWAYDYCPTPYAWMAILGMVFYLASFSPGMGPMPWTINSEIYPLWARGFGNALATFTNWAFNLLISMTFLSLSEAITRQGAFYLYASFGVVGCIFFFLFLPETKGRTLEEMESLFSGSWYVKDKSRQRSAD